MNNEKQLDNKAFLKAGLFSALFFCLFFGLALIFLYDLQAALIIAPISGLVFGLTMALLLYFFSKSKKINDQTSLEGIDESEIIYAGAANHFIRKEAVGGKLYLLNDTLIFKSHRLNIQNHSLSIRLDCIDNLTFFNPMIIVKNGLEVRLKDGSTEKFVVNNRDLWKHYMEQLIS